MNKKRLILIIALVLFAVGAVSVYAATRCGLCGGTGYRVCSNCNGTGYNQLGSGAGKFICRTCGGNGKVTCYSCKGAGWR
jgi:hypothetical protein